MKDNDLVTDIEYLDLNAKDALATVTYNYARSMQLFQQKFTKAFTDPDTGKLYEKSACIALEAIGGTLELYPNSVHLFMNADLLHNIQEMIENNPSIIDTFSNKALMNLLGKYLAREDIQKPNGDFNPLSILNCAKEDFGVDLLAKINIPFVSDAMIMSFLEKM